MGNNHPKGQIGREVQETDVLFNLDETETRELLGGTKENNIQRVHRFAKINLN